MDHPITKAPYVSIVRDGGGAHADTEADVTDAAETLAAFIAAVYGEYLQPREIETDEGDYAIVPWIKDGLAGKEPMPLPVWMHYAVQALSGQERPSLKTATAVEEMDSQAKIDALASALADHAKYAMEAEIRAQIVRQIVTDHGRELIDQLLVNSTGTD